jgi:hypothetical protein
MPCDVIEEIAQILADAIMRKTLDCKGVSSDTRSIV